MGPSPGSIRGPAAGTYVREAQIERTAASQGVGEDPSGQSARRGVYKMPMAEANAAHRRRRNIIKVVDPGRLLEVSQASHQADSPDFEDIVGQQGRLCVYIRCGH